TASAFQEAKIKCIANTDVLLVEGYEVDAIKSISTSSNVEAEWEQYFKEVDAMIDAATLVPFRDTRENLKWRVPIAGALYPKTDVSGAPDLRSSYAAFRNLIDSRQKSKMAVKDCSPVNGSDCFAQCSSYQKESMSYIEALQDTLQGWK